MAENTHEFVIGINGGGTRTTIALVDAGLKTIAQIETGPSNANVVGFDTVHSTLATGIFDLLKQVSGGKVIGIGAGIAGVDRPTEREQFVQMLSSIVPGVPVVVENDALPALVANTGGMYGIVTISGTGSIAVGVNAKGERARSGGWGYHIDVGSGYAIGKEALSAITAAYDGTGESTGLTLAVLEKLGLKDPTDLIAWMYAPNRRADEFASIASVVSQVSESDPVALRILVRGADLLAENVIAVARRLGMENAIFPVVMSGSVLQKARGYADRFVQTIRTVLPLVTMVMEEQPAALGAGMMALHATGRKPFKTGDDWARGTIPVKARRATEQRNVLTMNIHKRPTIDLVTIMNVEDQRVPVVVGKQLNRIAALIDAAAERWKRGGRLIFLGAGTSGRLAVLDAVECIPTYSTDRVVGILAGGADAMMRSIEGAEDGERDGAQAMETHFVGANDTVVGVAASGTTPFVVGALNEAGKRGALTASIASTVKAPISGIVQFPIVVPTGPEIVTGSTRLKSGTAQKMILNMISTGVMIRVGRTYGNLMTDVQATNVKLRERARVIVADATGEGTYTADKLLTDANGEIKTAIVMAKLHVSADEARNLLNVADGNLSAVVG